MVVELFLAIVGDAVFDFSQGLENGLLVGELGLVGEFFLDVDVAADSAGVEDGAIDAGGEEEIAAAPVEPTGEMGTVQTGLAGDAEFGVEIGGGGADVGGGGGELALGAANVGAAAEKFCW